MRFELPWKTPKALRGCDTGQNLEVGGVVGRVRICLGQVIEIMACPLELEGLDGMLY